MTVTDTWHVTELGYHIEHITMEKLRKKKSKKKEASNLGSLESSKKFTHRGYNVSEYQTNTKSYIAEHPRGLRFLTYILFIHNN